MFFSALVLGFSAACTGWQDETKGTMMPPVGPSPAAGGGGAAACWTCSDLVQASQGCTGANCPDIGDVCAGGASDAIDDFRVCLCAACPADCGEICGAGGGGTLEASATCQGCLFGAITGACGTEYANCDAN